MQNGLRSSVAEHDLFDGIKVLSKTHTNVKKWLFINIKTSFISIQWSGSNQAVDKLKNSKVYVKEWIIVIAHSRRATVLINCWLFS